MIQPAREALERKSLLQRHLRVGTIGQAGPQLLAAEIGTVVRPGRVRNRTKTEADEKVKKPADGVRKKSPPARKAPPRGRYVDEYARPAI